MVLSLENIVTGDLGKRFKSTGSSKPTYWDQSTLSIFHHTKYVSF